SLLVLLIECRIVNVFVFVLLFFFFQAEDGIRDLTVTGVQTCALPISISINTATFLARLLAVICVEIVERDVHDVLVRVHHAADRSEERRVGKSVECGGRSIIKKKKNDIM